MTKAPRPIGISQSINVTTSEAKTALDDVSGATPADSRTYLVSISATVAGAIAYIRFGDSSVTASGTANHVLIHGGIPPVPVRVPAGATHISTIGTATTVLNLTPVTLE